MIAIKSTEGYTRHLRKEDVLSIIGDFTVSTYCGGHLGDIRTVIKTVQGDEIYSTDPTWFIRDLMK